MCISTANSDCQIASISASSIPHVIFMCIWGKSVCLGESTHETERKREKERGSVHVRVRERERERERARERDKSAYKKYLHRPRMEKLHSCWPRTVDV